MPVIRPSTIRAMASGLVGRDPFGGLDEAAARDRDEREGARPALRSSFLAVPAQRQSEDIGDRQRDRMRQHVEIVRSEQLFHGGSNPKRPDWLPERPAKRPRDPKAARPQPSPARTGSTPALPPLHRSFRQAAQIDPGLADEVEQPGRRDFDRAVERAGGGIDEGEIPERDVEIDRERRGKAERADAADGWPVRPGLVGPSMRGRAPNAALFSMSSRASPRATSRNVLGPARIASVLAMRPARRRARRRRRRRSRCSARPRSRAARAHSGHQARTEASSSPGSSGGPDRPGLDQPASAARSISRCRSSSSSHRLHARLPRVSGPAISSSRRRGVICHKSPSDPCTSRTRSPRRLAHDRVPIAVGLFLIVGMDHEADGFVGLEIGPPLRPTKLWPSNVNSP